MNKLINKYNKIKIYHHVIPDGDCIGSQYGLFNLIKDNFENKEVEMITLTDQKLNFIDYIPSQTKDYEDNSDYLAIIVDTSSANRVDGDTWKKAKDLIVIDHHDTVNDKVQDQFENPKVFLEPEYPANAAYITKLAIDMGWKISEKAAKYLMIGFITDTGSLIERVSKNNSLKIYEYLMTKTNAFEIKRKVDAKTKEDLKTDLWIINNIKITENFNYLIAEKEDLINLNTNWKDFYRSTSFKLNKYGKPKISFILVYADNETYKLSLRSQSDVRVDTIAARFDGGGHKWASGAYVNKKEIDKLFNIVEKKTNNE